MDTTVSTMKNVIRHFSLRSLVSSTAILVLLTLTFACALYLVCRYFLPAARPSTVRYDKQTRSWNVYRYDDFVALIRNPNITANFMPSLMSGIDQTQRIRFTFLERFFVSWPQFQEGSKQRHLHSLLASFVSSRQLHAMEGQVRHISEKLVDGLQPKQQWDAVNDFAKPLSLRSIALVLGFPFSDISKLQNWIDVVEDWFGGHRSMLEQLDKCQAALQEFTSYMESILEGIDADSAQFGDGHPMGVSRAQPCLIQQMAAASRRGGMLPEELIPNVFFLLVAGCSTTASLVVNSLLVLLHPDNERQLRYVQGNPAARLGPCIDELLRFCPPVKKLVRQVRAGSKDFFFRDCLMRAGQTVNFVTATANMDPVVFGETAEKFDVRRRSGSSGGMMKKTKMRKHLGFGVGDHTCPGQLLGRLEAKVALEMVLFGGKFPGLELAQAPDEMKRLLVGPMSMIVTLPVKRNPKKCD
jgi:cytochrome P450